MKLFNWLDGFFSTPSQRKNWLGLVFCLYCLWQGFWICLVYGKLISVQSYEQLFEFYGTMSQYTYSYLFRVVSRLIEAVYLDGSAIVLAIVSSASAWDILFWACGLVYILAEWKKRRMAMLLIMAALQLLVIICSVITGISASSIMEVVRTLQYMSWTNLILSLGCACILIERVIHTVYRILEQKLEKTGKL